MRRGILQPTWRNLSAICCICALKDLAYQLEHSHRHEIRRQKPLLMWKTASQKAGRIQTWKARLGVEYTTEACRSLTKLPQPHVSLLKHSCTANPHHHQIQSILGTTDVTGGNAASLQQLQLSCGTSNRAPTHATVSMACTWVCAHIHSDKAISTA